MECGDGRVLLGGFLRIALYGGGQVLRLSPTGKRLGALKFPARNITSCCLGGRDLRTLYVTSGRAAEGDEPEGGAVFATDVEISGLPEPSFRLD